MEVYYKTAYFILFYLIGNRYLKCLHLKTIRKKVYSLILLLLILIQII